MSLQWTLIATVLYFEMAFMFLLILPIFSTRRLHKMLKSKVVQALSAQAGWYFGCTLAILGLFFLDAIREMRKYASNDVKEAHGHLDAEMQNNMKLFRAQRNFYISGFSLFLWLVIRQVMQLISQQAQLMAQNEASLNQARQASVAAQQLLDGPRGKFCSCCYLKNNLITYIYVLMCCIIRLNRQKLRFTFFKKNKKSIFCPYVSMYITW